MSLQIFGHFSMSKYKFFLMAMFIILLSFSLTIFTNNIDNVFATTAADEEDNSKNANDNEDKFYLTININLNNIKQFNPQLFKLVAFVNGDVQTKIIDLKKMLQYLKIP